MIVRSYMVTVVDSTKCRWRGRLKLTLELVVQKDLGFVCWTSQYTMLSIALNGEHTFM